MNRGPVRIAAAAMLLASIWGGSLSAAAPPAGGTISIEPAIADAAPDSSMAPFVSAAREALGARGFTILQDTGHAAYIAELTVSRIDVGTGSAKVAAGGSTIVPGGAPGGVGAGAVVGLPSGKSRLVALQRIRLELRIRKRGAEKAVWEGAAITVRATGTQKGADERVAADLSEAVLRSYPAEPGDVVAVP